MRPQPICKDVEILRFSRQLLNPDRHNIVVCPKCGNEIKNRYFAYSRTFARCLYCDVCYYLSKDHGKTKPLPVVFE